MTTSAGEPPATGGSLAESFVVRLWEPPERSRDGRARASRVSSSTSAAAAPRRSWTASGCLRSSTRNGVRRAPQGEHRDAAGSLGDPAAARRLDTSPAGPYGRFVRGSSIVGSASRSRWTLSTKSSSSVGTTRSFALRRSRSRRRRASAPTTPETLGHSAATTTRTPRASRTIHGQLTRSILRERSHQGVARRLPRAGGRRSPRGGRRRGPSPA